ncbi:MAG: hypothetical protein H7210_14135, partial [Pyrinomonadaceae bacterium]|nr:hypothetical protein [Phycisphaerales bacterium]
TGRARLAAAFCAAAFVSVAQAYTFEYRIVERIGNTDHVLPSNDIHVRPGSARRLRIQFRVVPDGPEDATAGFLAWNVGTITTTGGINSRTAQPPNPNPRGRLAPFFSAGQATAEGAPLVDPFTEISAIDVALIIRTLPWLCGPDGLPLPQPAVPEPYGRGEFVSVFEITSIATPATYTITFAGNLIAGRDYRTIVCNPPECGDPQTPGDDMPSSCDYAPRPYPPQPFSLQLTIQPLCGEWNNDYVVNSQDVFDFFQSFFAGDADVNSDGVTNSADYFAYIIGFVRGCR